MITSTIHVLLVTPLIFLIMKRYALRRGELHLSGLRAGQALDQREMAAPTPTEQII